MGGGGCAKTPTAGHTSGLSEVCPAVWRGALGSGGVRPEPDRDQPLKLRPVMRFAHTDWASC